MVETYKEYGDLEKAVKDVLEKVEVLKGKEEFRGLEKLVDGVGKKCIATLIEDFYWGD